MTDMWFFGVISVNRSKRELRIWLCRQYSGLSLPVRYSFFAVLLYELFREGYVNRFQRLIYETNGLLAKNPTNAPMGLDYMPPEDTSRIIEHVEMIRWCGTPEDDNGEYKDHTLQAEYVVRVVDSNLISPISEPSFIGNIYSSTSAFINLKDTTRINVGKYQKTVIYPPAIWKINKETLRKSRKYLSENLSTVNQLLDASKLFLKKDLPKDFHPAMLPQLSGESQKQLISLLVYSKRNDNIFQILHSNAIFHIFSYISFDDARYERRRVYIALQKYRAPTFDFNLLHDQTSIRHFGIRHIVNALIGLCNQREERIVFDIVERSQQEKETELYIANLERIVSVILSLDSKLFPGRTNQRTMLLERLKTSKRETVSEFLDNTLLTSTIV